MYKSLRLLVTGFAALPERFRRVTSSTSYNSQIDGMRFLAILPVVIYHIALRGDRLIKSERPLSEHEIWQKTWLPDGNIGVMLFFFVSGYIIAFPFLRGLYEQRARPGIREFYLRRMLRLGPPYLLVLVAAYVMLAATGYAPTDSPRFMRAQASLHESFMASLLYIHNLWFGVPSKLNPPLWSLEIEMQFYLVAPLILLAYAAIRHHVMRWILQVAAVGLALIFAHWASLIGAMAGRHEWSLFGYLHFFLLGILMSDLALARGGAAWRTRGFADGALLSGFLLLLVTGMGEAMPGWLSGPTRDALQLLAILGIYYGAMAGPIGRRILGAPWIALIGGMCYSIYLTHVPVAVIVGQILKQVWVPSTMLAAWILSLAVMIPVMFAVALLLYVLVEYPCMSPRWPQRLGSYFRSFARRREEGASVPADIYSGSPK